MILRAPDQPRLDDDDRAVPRVLAVPVAVGAVAVVGFLGFVVGAATLTINIIPANVGWVILAIIVGCTATILPAHAWRERLFLRRARELGLDDVGIDAVRRAVRVSLVRQRQHGRVIVPERVRDDIRTELARALPASSSPLR